MRLKNGVRARATGRGDPWAEAHRAMLGNKFYLQDVDAIVGSVRFAKNTANGLFMEYVPDSFDKRGDKARQFGVVALFDRKRSRRSAIESPGSITMALYLHVARSLRAAQNGLAPKFFYVIGGESPPWELVEVDIDTGDVVSEGVEVNTRDYWAPVWEQLGLVDLQRELRKIVDP